MSRSRRRTAERHERIRRMLVEGAVVGLAVGVAGQWLVDGVEGEIRTLVRIALLLPAVIFIAWWMSWPRPYLEHEQELAEAELELVDPADRIRRIESAFDSTAVPRPRRVAFDEVDEAAREQLLRSVPRRTSDMSDRTSYGFEHRRSAGG